MGSLAYTAKDNRPCVDADALVWSCKRLVFLEPTRSLCRWALQREENGVYALYESSA